MAKAKSVIATLTENIKDVVAEGINNEKLKEKIEEYIEISKLKITLAKEILEIGKESSKTKEYLDDLESDLKEAQKEIEQSKTLNNLLEDEEDESI